MDEKSDRSWAYKLQYITWAGGKKKEDPKMTNSHQSQFLKVLDTPSEEKDILVCIITATQLSCNYTGTWHDGTNQG